MTLSSRANQTVRLWPQHLSLSLQEILFDSSMFLELFSKFSSSQRITVDQFRRFLKEEQGECPLKSKTHSPSATPPEEGPTKTEVAAKIVDYLQDPSRHVQEPYFTQQEFMDFLFSKENQVKANNQ